MCFFFFEFYENRIIVLCQVKFQIQDVDNYVERVDNFVDMFQKRLDKAWRIRRKKQLVFDTGKWIKGKKGG